MVKQETERNIMVTFVIFVVLLCELVFGNTETQNPLSDEFIDLINSKQNSWKAGRNFSPYTPLSNIKRLMGSGEKNYDYLPKLLKMEHDTELITTLPQQFDPRDKWPNCASLNEIRDQGSCSNSWAFAAVEAMTDRYCIYSNGTQQFYFSAEDLMTCCWDCSGGNGCLIGIGTAAWNYWVEVGIVSGGSYNSSQGCAPYQIPPCTHNNTTGKLPNCRREVDTAECKTSCNNPNYKVEYYKDKRSGKQCYWISSVEGHIRAELFLNGPVHAVLLVYEDFLHYKSGVYQYTHGKELGELDIKILGWGVEDGIKYWLVANSWNADWGDKGFVKILRGSNHCHIESLILAGEPRYD